MTFRSHSALIKKHFRLLLLVVAAIGLCGLAIGARAMLKTTLLVATPVPEIASMTLTQQKDATRLPTHTLTLHPNGFEPAEVRWQRGPFFLTIDNRSGVNDITLRLDREAGGRLKEVNLKMRKQRSAGVIDPPPGKYVLSEANHPNWLCRIIITAQ